MANVSYLKEFSFNCSIHLVGRKTPNSVSNYLSSCLSKFDSLSFTFNSVLCKLSMLSCVVIFCPAQRKLSFQPNITIFDNDKNKYVSLERKEFVKYLGIFIDKIKSNLETPY